MRSLLHRTILLTSPSHSLIRRTSLSAMATTASSSLLLPSISLNNLSSSKNASFGFAAKNLSRSRISMSVSAGSQSTTVHDSLFADYKPTSAFLFPGQGAQAVGMGKESQSVGAAGELYKKANDILGYDLLETLNARYHGRKDLISLIEFYEEATGLQPVQYVAEGEPTGLNAGDGNLITWLRKGTSIREIFKQDPFLVLSLLFICLQMAILVFPIAESRMRALWASYVANLNLGRFGEISQLFNRGIHMVDVRRLWLKLSLVKTRNFHERAKNAQAWASSLASVSLGQTSSDQS